MLVRATFATGLLFTACLATEAQAQSYCMEPRRPSSLFLTKPSKPYCAMNRSCRDYEIESYKSEVRRYFDQLQEYADSVERFHKQAGEYIECMSKLE